MTNHDFDHWALTDEELEALLAGATPADLERVGNPVAEFFADARSGRGIRPARPDASLRQFFSDRPDLRPESPRSAPAAAPTAFSTPAPTPAGGLERQRADHAPSVDYAQTGGHASEHRRPAPTQQHWVRPERGSGVQSAGTRTQPAMDRPYGSQAAASGSVPPATQPRSLLGGAEEYRPDVPVVNQYAELPTPTLGDYLGQAMQPAGAKILIGAATLLLFLAVGQLLGFVSLPFGGDGQRVGTSGLSAADAPTGAVTATTEALTGEGGGLSTFATLAVPGLNDSQSGTDPASPTTVEPASQATTSTTTATTTPTIQQTTATTERQTSSTNVSSTVVDPTSSTTEESSSTTTDGTSTTATSTSSSTSTTDGSTTTTIGSSTTSGVTTSTSEQTKGNDDKGKPGG